MDYSRDLTGALLRIALWRRAEWKTDVHPGIRETLESVADTRPRSVYRKMTSTSPPKPADLEAVLRANRQA
jgi:hypothetical protein